eukprot:764506-Hanusia_phi.AAC.4
MFLASCTVSVRGGGGGGGEMRREERGERRKGRGERREERGERREEARGGEMRKSELSCCALTCGSGGGT